MVASAILLSVLLQEQPKYVEFPQPSRLIGKTKEQVIEILGEPSERAKGDPYVAGEVWLYRSSNKWKFPDLGTVEFAQNAVKVKRRQGSAVKLSEQQCYLMDRIWNTAGFLGRYVDAVEVQKIIQEIQKLGKEEGIETLTQYTYLEPVFHELATGGASFEIQPRRFFESGKARVVFETMLSSNEIKTLTLTSYSSYFVIPANYSSTLNGRPIILSEIIWIGDAERQSVENRSFLSKIEREWDTLLRVGEIDERKHMEQIYKMIESKIPDKEFTELWKGLVRAQNHWIPSNSTALANP